MGDRAVLSNVQVIAVKGNIAVILKYSFITIREAKM